MSLSRILWQTIPMVTTKKAPAKKAVAKTVSTQGVVEPHDRIDWRSFYLYAVCIITLMVCLFSLVSLLKNGIQIIFLPDPVYPDAYSPKVEPGSEGYVDRELVAQNQQDQNQRYAIRRVVDSIIAIVIAGPLYLYHWRMASRARS